MALNQKHVFWEALVISLFIFGAGLVLGILIENNRSNETLRLYLASETNLLDIQIFSDLLLEEDLDCEFITRKNINFGNEIYSDALIFQQYEKARRISPEIRENRERFDLLRTLFWINSKKIQENCENFSIIVYLYQHPPQDSIEEAKQEVFSRYLGNLKRDFQDSIMLIPLSYNSDLVSLQTLLAEYDIEKTSILVDSNFTVSNQEDLHKIRDYLSKKTN